MTPTKYRCLTVGGIYRYGPKLGKGDDTRRGTNCTTVIVPQPRVIGNVLVRFLTGMKL